EQEVVEQRGAVHRLREALRVAELLLVFAGELRELRVHPGKAALERFGAPDEEREERTGLRMHDALRQVLRLFPLELEGGLLGEARRRRGEVEMPHCPGRALYQIAVVVAVPALPAARELS